MLSNGSPEQSSECIPGWLRMTSNYLIDGYNLLYALGALEGRTQAPGALERARLRLLGQLHAVFGDDGQHVTVVFDAAHSPRGGTGEQTFRRLHVRFAIHDDEADDLIEKLIKKDATPRQLVVVSDDHRIQTAGRRRHCQVKSCEAFLDWLERERRKKPPEEQAAAEKTVHLTEEETQRWLTAFGDLDSDPAMKELFEPFDFEK